MRPQEFVAQTIAKGQSCVLYEGLPHQRYEAELLDEEVRTKETLQFYGFAFYAEVLKLKPKDAKKLAGILAHWATFEEYSPGKRCGGFHPDYCVEWRVGIEAYRWLICLGCFEGKLAGPSSETHYDVSPKARASLQELLVPYHKNRPDSAAHPKNYFRS